MVKEKYPVEEATKEKINELFAYRRLHDLLGMSNMAKDRAFMDQLTDLQYQIYMLDGYLESRWDLEKQSSKKYWESIELSLRNMGFKKKSIGHLLAEIKDYELMEKNCREDKWPTSVSFRKFYTTKSCDVRLIRHLIYHNHADLENLWKEKSWRFFDLITEIHDDIEDLREDIRTYNGNRFLVSILRKGGERTRQEYEAFLVKITEKAKEYFEDKMDKGKNKQLAAWTDARSKETIKLLNATFRSKVMDELSQSLLLGQME